MTSPASARRARRLVALLGLACLAAPVGARLASAKPKPLGWKRGPADPALAADSGGPTPLQAGPVTTSHLEFRPADCRRPACGTRDRHGDVVLVAGNGKATVITKSGDFLPDLALSPDGKLIAAVRGTHVQRGGEEVFVGRSLVLFRGGKPFRHIDPRGNVERLRLLDAARRVALKIRTPEGPGQILLYDVASGRALGSARAEDPPAALPAWARDLAD